jgi:hypothetical protein
MPLAVSPPLTDAAITLSVRHSLTQRDPTNWDKTSNRCLIRVYGLSFSPSFE